MNIAEAERRTGLTRANIRFYEKEGLLKPTRGENGYRDYTEDNVQTPVSYTHLTLPTTF